MTKNGRRLTFLVINTPTSCVLEFIVYVFSIAEDKIECQSGKRTILTVGTVAGVLTGNSKS